MGEVMIQPYTRYMKWGMEVVALSLDRGRLVVVRSRSYTSEVSPERSFVELVAVERGSYGNARFTTP